MYERFTDRGRKVLQLANQEAHRFNHEYIGTEHILLGLVREGSGIAANVLKNLYIDSHKVRLEVEKIIQSGPDGVVESKLPQTPRAKKVLEYAVEEARNLNHNYVSTEHLLLGLLREQECVAAQVLMNLGLNLGGLRGEILNLLGHDEPIDPSVRALQRSLAVIPLPSPCGIEPDLPPETRPAVEMLNSEIEQLTIQKVAAVAEQDFELAAELFDQANRMKKRKQQIVSGWTSQHPILASWLSYQDGMVVKVARAIALDRRWDDFPILGDALEEAGCTDRVILDHCRRPAGHQRGCWVLQAILGVDG